MDIVRGKRREMNIIEDRDPNISEYIIGIDLAIKGSGKTVYGHYDKDGKYIIDKIINEEE